MLHKNASLSQSPQIASHARNSALWMKVEHQLQHSPGLPNQSCIFFLMLLVSNMLKYIGYSSKEWNFLSFYVPFLWDAADRQSEERWQTRLVSGLVASEKPPVPQRWIAVRSPFFMAYEAHVSRHKSWHLTQTALSPVWVQIAWAGFHVRHRGWKGMPSTKGQDDVEI